MNSSFTERQTFVFNLNGRRVVWQGDPTQPLADVLREHLGLTGTKIGCRTGECGACTVLLDGKPIVSCITPVASVHEAEVRTVEGIAEEPDFQELALRMQEEGGVQCGFCTPGIMVALWAWMQDPELWNGDPAAALKNNLCRCTGYRGILDAIQKTGKKGDAS